MFENELMEFKREHQKYRSFLPSLLITANFPLRDIKKPVFVRKYNGIEFYLTGVQNVPSGKYSRLLLSILTTHAVLSKDETVINYRSITELLTELKIPRSRGKDVIEQLELLSMSSFHYKMRVRKTVKGNMFEEGFSDKEYIATLNKMGSIPFMKSLTWVDIQDGKKDRKSYGFQIVLSDEFTKVCREHAVPIDYSVYSDIKSALGKDLYAWIVYRNNCLSESESLYISRDRLIDQFFTFNVEDSMSTEAALRSANYASIKEKIMEIKSDYYQDLRISFDEKGGLTLRKSPLVINVTDTKYMLVTADEGN